MSHKIACEATKKWKEKFVKKATIAKVMRNHEINQTLYPLK